MPGSTLIARMRTAVLLALIAEPLLVVLFGADLLDVLGYPALAAVTLTVAAVAAHDDVADAAVANVSEDRQIRRHVGRFVVGMLAAAVVLPLIVLLAHTWAGDTDLWVQLLIVAGMLVLGRWFAINVGAIPGVSAAVIAVAGWPGDPAPLLLVALPLLYGQSWHHRSAGAEPPRLRTQRLVCYSVAVLPLGMAMPVSERPALELACGVVITLTVWCQLVTVGRTLRVTRWIEFIFTRQSVVFPILLAVSPLGSPLVEAWLRVTPLHENLGWPLVLLAVVAAGLEFPARRYSWARGTVFLLAPVRWAGLLAFTLAIVYSRPELLPVAFALSIVEALRAVAGWFTDRPRHDLATVGSSWHEWVHDAVLRPWRPDYRLVAWLTAYGRATAEFAADHWLDLAESALGTLESQLSALHPARRARLEHGLDIRAALLWEARASVSQRTGRHEDATRYWMLAISTWYRLEATVQADHARLILVTNLARQSMFDDARELLDTVLEDEVNPILRRFAYYALADIESRRGSTESARDALELARALPLPRRAAREMAAASATTWSSIPGWLVAMVSTSRMARHLRRTQDLLDSVICQRLDGTPLRPTTTFNESRDLTLRAASQLSLDQPAKARRTALKALRLARKRGQTAWVARASEVVADATPDANPAEKLASVLAALQAREDTRALLHRPDLRIVMGSANTEPRYTEAIDLLAWQPPAELLSRPGRATEAFDLAEQCHARQLLEDLGNAAASRIESPLVTHERRLTRMYQESWEDPPGNPREGIDSREQLRQTLQAVRDLLAQSGEQEAAYADLRRGKPLNYDQVRALLND